MDSPSRFSRMTSASSSLSRKESSSMRPLACTARTISQTARVMGIPNTTKTTIGINCSIKFPFCGRNDLDERSLRFGARYWQAGMTSLAWPQQNGPRGADFDSFSRHNDSRPVAMKLIDKKRGCFAKINAQNPEIKIAFFDGRDEAKTNRQVPEQ
jgi:hypothetical protein